MTPPEPTDDTGKSSESLNAEHVAGSTDVTNQTVPPVIQPVPDAPTGSSDSPIGEHQSPSPQSPQPVAPSNTEATTRAGNVRDVLNDSVALHMRSAGPLLRAGASVEQSLQTLRTSPTAGRVIYFYVVDDEGRLQGVVGARKLLLSPADTKLADIMSTHTIEIPSTATVLEACEFFTLHKLLAFPVVDQNHKVIGAVDVDLYTEEIQEIDRRQDADDLFQLIGVHLSEAAEGNARLAFVGRFPWLLCNVAGGMLSALIADAYQDISTLAVVAPFIALVTALAESVSIQSVSLSLQMLHSQPPKWNTFARKVAQELLVGALLGGACGLTVGAIAWVWKGSFVVAASLFLGILGGIITSAVIGLAIPVLFKLCRRNPQLASGPIALAVSDVVTLLCYFNLGRWLLRS